MNFWLEAWRQAWRSVSRRPAFSILAVGALAVAIGGSTLLLSLYDSIALRDLPLARPGELVSVRERPTPRVYAPFDGDESTATLHVRTADGIVGLRANLERLLRELAPGAAIGPIRTLAERRDRSLGRDLSMRDLAVWFGASSVALAALGLFAVLSYAVRIRRRELGLRQALGALPADLRLRVFADGLRPLLAGLALGLVIAAAAGRYSESLLYEISARDPWAFAAASAAMLVVGVAAVLPAAQSAVRIDPASALRSD